MRALAHFSDKVKNKMKPLKERQRTSLQDFSQLEEQKYDIIPLTEVNYDEDSQNFCSQLEKISSLVSLNNDDLDIMVNGTAIDDIDNKSFDKYFLENKVVKPW
mmetsp:Transcript_20500/g.28832  ORF Transcript_20500/g.28832 Transcript_20500/m.28832 type:complete len:103 (+) Transcript_20500:1979-2287(+)